MHIRKSSALKNRNQTSFILCMDLGPDFPDPEGAAAERLSYWGAPRKPSAMGRIIQAAVSFAMPSSTPQPSMQLAAAKRMPSQAKSTDVMAPKPSRSAAKARAIHEDLGIHDKDAEPSRARHDARRQQSRGLRAA